MAYPDFSPRVGRSQGVLIFWGLISASFAGLFVFYYWKNHENESLANKLRDEVINLQNSCDVLNSQREKLQASMSERENNLKTREEFLQDKETKLAAEESRLESQGPKPAHDNGTDSGSVPAANSASGSQASTPAEAAMVKKFADTVRKLTKDDDGLITRNGRPVLRLPSSTFFASGDAVLKTGGRSVLNQIVQAFDGTDNHFELRIATYTDSEPEPHKVDAAKPSNIPRKEGDSNEEKPLFATPWDLTSARAAALTKALKEQSTLAFPNIVVTPRGDADPIVTDPKGDHSRNRRIEITFAPAASAYHPSGSLAEVAPDPLAPPPDPQPASSAKKDTPKSPETDSDKNKAKPKTKG